MQVVILCGGLGTRLREETEFRPKPMVNIGNRPIIWHIMKYYAHHGHTEFILPLGYKGEMIKNYFYNYELMNNDVTIELGKSGSLSMHDCHDECGWKISMINTGWHTLKGGRIKRIEKYVNNDTFMLTYGDGVANVNLDELLKFHMSHGKIATLTGINPTSRFGKLKVAGNMISSFHEKPECEDDDFVNGGFFVLNRKIFDYLTVDSDFEFGPLEKLANDGELMIYKHIGFWACMDTVRDMEYLNRIWAEGKSEWKIW